MGDIVNLDSARVAREAYGSSMIRNVHAWEIEDAARNASIESLVLLASNLNQKGNYLQSFTVLDEICKIERAELEHHAKNLSEEITYSASMVFESYFVRNEVRHDPYLLKRCLRLLAFAAIFDRDNLEARLKLCQGYWMHGQSDKAAKVAEDGIAVAYRARDAKAVIFFEGKLKRIA